SLHLVVDDRLALARRLEADRGLHPWMRVLMVAIPPRAVIAGRASFGAGALSHRRELVRACIAAVGVAFGEKLECDLAMPLGARELINRLAIPTQPQTNQNRPKSGKN